MKKILIIGQEQNNDQKNKSKINKNELQSFYQSIGLKYEFSEEEINERYNELYEKKSVVKDGSSKAKEVFKGLKEKAKSKVEKLDKTKITDTIKSGAKKASEIIEKAGRILIPEKEVDLENDRDIEENLLEDEDLDRD